MKTIQLEDKEYKKLRSIVESGMYSMDPTGDPEDTQFGYCVYCFKVEYVPHRKDCEGVPLFDLFNINYSIDR